MSVPRQPKPGNSLRRPSAYIDPAYAPGGARAPPIPGPSQRGAGPAAGLADVSSRPGPGFPPPGRPLQPHPAMPSRPPRQHMDQGSRGPPPAPSSRSQGGSAAPAGSTERKSKVGAALLSKRQSVSYANVPSRGLAPPVPAMPAIRDDLSDAPSTEQVRAPLPGSLDINALQQDDFDAERFLKRNLNTEDPNAIKAIRAKLLEVQGVTNQDLQEGVYKNYSAFIAISKEIATLENEMLELKTVLEDFKTLPGSLAMGAGIDDAPLIGGSITSDIRRRTARNSIADVNALYKAQLEALWESIDGAQKFVPHVPGRHLQAESTSFVELHAATYRPKQNVVLFLLNDALLVCVRRRMGVGTAKVRLVAEKCFSLNEIAVIDLKDGGDLNNAIKIKKGRDVTIFRTDKAEDKKALLGAFKKVAEDMANKKRKQSILEAENRQNSGRRMADGLVPLPAGAAAQIAAHSVSSAKILGLGKDDATGRDLSWVGDLSDELAVLIAVRDYEPAVVLVEKAKTLLPSLAGDAVASSMLRQKLDVRSAELAAALLHDLSDHNIRKSGVVKLAGWLLRLGTGAGERAREAFLEMRGKLVRKRSRMIRFEGDISLWVGELAMVVFTLVKNTCEWYRSAFRDNRMASGFVCWASQQIEVYAEMFRRQVYGIDEDGKVVQESLAVTRAHAAMLKDVGLDFGFLLDSLLQPESQLRQRPSTGQIGDLAADEKASLSRQ